jgi:pyridoxamine 5'-phosphate oxidase
MTSQYLETRLEEFTKKFEGVDKIPLPDFWGGYRIIPSRIEFWKGRSNRMHDRIEFYRTLSSDGSYGAWVGQRLQP